MASGQNIRAGGAFVEVFATTTALEKGLRAASARMQSFGTATAAIGAKIGALGAGIAAPLAIATKSFTNYEDGLAQLKAAANPTAEEMKAIEAAAIDISKAAGIGPTAAVAAMTELLKAGLPLEQVLNGTAEATLKFARVAGIDAAQAATVLTDAMNVFGVDAPVAMDTLSQAADASSISLQDVVMSFSQAAAVAGLVGLDINETANAIAVLGQAGIKGSDAGTSLRTMLLHLINPTEKAKELMADMAFNVREADGSLKDFRGIIAAIQTSFAGMNAAAREEAFGEIFGGDAIRAAGTFFTKGVAGWDEFAAKMGEGLSVSQKFTILMGTLSASGDRLWAALERTAITIGEALAPAIAGIIGMITPLIDKFGEWVMNNKELVVGLGLATAALVGAGAALVVIGVSVSAASLAFSGLSAILGTLTPVLLAFSTPIGAVVAGTAAMGAAFLATSEDGREAFDLIGQRMEGVLQTARVTFAGIGDALKQGDIALAGKIAIAGLDVAWREGLIGLKALFWDFIHYVRDQLTSLGEFMLAGPSAWGEAIGTALGGGAEEAVKQSTLGVEEARQRLATLLAQAKETTTATKEAARMEATPPELMGPPEPPMGPPRPELMGPPAPDWTPADEEEFQAAFQDALEGYFGDAAAGVMGQTTAETESMLAQRGLDEVAMGAMTAMEDIRRATEGRGTFSAFQAAAMGMGEGVLDQAKLQQETNKKLDRMLEELRKRPTYAP